MGPQLRMSYNTGIPEKYWIQEPTWSVLLPCFFRVPCIAYSFQGGLALCNDCNDPPDTQHPLFCDGWADTSLINNRPICNTTTRPELYGRAKNQLELVKYPRRVLA